MAMPPTIVRIQEAGWEVVCEVPGIFGNAAAVAARLRADGLAARKQGNDVLVNANGPLPKQGT